MRRMLYVTSFKEDYRILILHVVKKPGLQNLGNGLDVLYLVTLANTLQRGEEPLQIGNFLIHLHECL